MGGGESRLHLMVDLVGDMAHRVGFFEAAESGHFLWIGLETTALCRPLAGFV